MASEVKPDQWFQLVEGSRSQLNSTLDISRLIDTKGIKKVVGQLEITKSISLSMDPDQEITAYYFDGHQAVDIPDFKTLIEVIADPRIVEIKNPNFPETPHSHKKLGMYLRFPNQDILQKIDWRSWKNLTQEKPFYRKVLTVDDPDNLSSIQGLFGKF